MKIAVLADIYNNYALVEEVVDELRGEKVDLLVMPGDITHQFSIPPDTTPTDLALLVLQKAFLLRVPVFCVPGNHDPYELTRLFEELGTNIQEHVVSHRGVAFMGWGGAATPFGTRFEPNEEETAAFLSFMEKKIPRPFVLVVHNPPQGTTLDVVEKKHVGSAAVRDFILRARPLLVLSAHIEEAAGTDRLGETTLFYPGPLARGNYGIVTIDGASVRTDIRTLRRVAAADGEKGDENSRHRPHE